MVRIAVFFFGALLFAAPAFARFEPVTCSNNPLTQDQEIAEGNKVALEVYKQMPVLPDTDPIARYVQGVGARVAAQAPMLPGVARQWPFNFHVVASSEINAFALPGGTMFINLGAIQAAENEAQLAGVIGHELSHVIMRHSTCNLKRQQNKSLLYGLGQIGAAILLKDGAAGQLAQGGLSLGQNLDFLHMSRGDEQQADLLGVNLLEQANYDPRGLPQFFEIIQAKVGSGGAQFLSDHPNPGNRTQYTNAEIATLPPLDHPTMRTAAFTQTHALAAQTRALTAQETKSGEWKQSGHYAAQPGDPGRGSSQYTPADTPDEHNPGGLPAGQSAWQPAAVLAPLPRASLGFRDRLVLEQAPRWSIRYPSSWRATSSSADDRQQERTPEITLAPQGGAGSFGVAYGVVIGIEQQDAEGVSDAEDLQRAAQPILARYLQNSGLTQAGSVMQTQIAGKAALAVELIGSSPVGDARGHVQERDLLVLVVRPDGNISYLVFVAPQQDYPMLRPRFDAMLRTFSPQ